MRRAVVSSVRAKACDLFERCGRKTPDEIGARRNVRPGRGLFQIEPQAMFRRNACEIIEGVPAGGVDSFALRGSDAVHDTARVAGSQHDQREMVCVASLNISIRKRDPLFTVA